MHKPLVQAYQVQSFKLMQTKIHADAILSVFFNTKSNDFPLDAVP